MARQPNSSTENNFIGGLKTEFTGLNFPENACTETSNCVFSRIGNVTRRLGFNYEENHTMKGISRTGLCTTNYVWYNADGGGLVDLYVLQVGDTLYFSDISAATKASPLSTKFLASEIDLSAYIPIGSSVALGTIECQFATGNGYLFVFHPNLDAFYCSYSSGVVTASKITVKTRDTVGVEESAEDNNRPTVLNDLHRYNLGNQGWGKVWQTSSTSSLPIGTGNRSFGVATAGLPIAAGERVKAYDPTSVATDHSGTTFNKSMIGTVVSYAGSFLVINVTDTTGTGTFSNWTIEPEPNLITRWLYDVGTYPSNSDIWWRYKTPTETGTNISIASGGTTTQTTSSSNVEEFNPKKTINNVTANQGAAPKGHYILEAFNQDRNTASQWTGLTTVTSNSMRPTTGAWFAGRVWYSGVNYKSFNENIYFSQIIENKSQFGKCHQVNDPTSEETFDLLPSDGGVIVIQGASIIYKLFPVQNGILVFASNGIWFITGSQGIGFTATDYTIVKLSEIKSISGSSFVNVQGYPFWWNEDGIYTISPSEQGGLAPKSITHITIASFYAAIPLSSKKYARGDFSALGFNMQWVYRSTEENDINSRYEFDGILDFSTVTEGFSSWTVDAIPKIHGIKYIQGLGGSMPESTFKYLTSVNLSGLTFSEERDTNYLDWDSEDYDSYFVTGYKLHGGAQRKFQSNYVYMFSDNSEDTEYVIQSVWNFATSGLTGKLSVPQQVYISQDNFSSAFRKHKLRGTGLALQFKISSQPRKPFNIIGWSVFETVNARI